MPITEHQRRNRRRYLGSSDAPAVLGLSRYKSAYDVYLEKTGQVEDSGGAVSEAAEIGTMIEDSLLDWAAAQTGFRIRKNQARVHRSKVLACSHDALGINVDGSFMPVGFEAKTTGILNRFSNSDEWGDEGTDQVPETVLVQCAHQMVVSGLREVWVPALIGGRGRVLFHVEHNEKLCGAVEKHMLDFWNKHVVPRVAPYGSTPSLEVVRRVRREPETVVEVPEGLVEKWLLWKDAKKTAEAEEESALAVLLAAMGSAEGGRCSLGLVTHKSGTRSSLDTKGLRAAHPEIAAAFTRESATHTTRFKPSREGGEA